MSYTRRHWQDCYHQRTDQADYSDRKRDTQGRQDFITYGDKVSCGYCGRKGKHNSPE